MKVLFVGCFNLGPEASIIVNRICPGATIKLWRRGDEEGKKRIREEILAESWGVLFSFYNDYLFSPEEIGRAILPINIHPSLERGRGYDTIPLIEDHTHHGIMMHMVDRKIDHGPIIEVEEVPVPRGINYFDFRRRNQILCLKMLERYLAEIARSDSALVLKAEYQERAKSLNRPWGERYISANYLGKTLRKLRETDPNHRVFYHLPEEIIQFGNEQLIPNSSL